MPSHLGGGYGGGMGGGGGGDDIKPKETAEEKTVEKKPQPKQAAGLPSLENIKLYAANFDAMIAELQQINLAHEGWADGMPDFFKYGGQGPWQFYAGSDTTIAAKQKHWIYAEVGGILSTLGSVEYSLNKKGLKGAPFSFLYNELSQTFSANLHEQYEYFFAGHEDFSETLHWMLEDLVKSGQDLDWLQSKIKNKGKPFGKGGECCWFKIEPMNKISGVLSRVDSISQAFQRHSNRMSQVYEFKQKVDLIVSELSAAQAVQEKEAPLLGDTFGMGNPNKPPSLLGDEAEEEGLSEEGAKEALEGKEPTLTIKDLISVPLTLKGAKGVRFSPKYNFYLAEYEEAIADNPSTIEQLLPNLYVHGFYNQIKDKTSAAWMKKLMMLSAKAEEEEPKGGEAGFFEAVDKKNVEHFKEWGNDFIGKQFGDMGAIQERFTNIVIPAADMRLFNDLAEQNVMFPMCVEIEFPTDTTTQIAEILKKAKLSKAFMETVYGGSFTASTIDLSSEVLNSWNITEWFDDVFETNTPEDVPDDTIILDTGSEANFHKNSLQKTLSLMMLKAKVSAILKKPEDQLPYFETVFYRVEKRTAGGFEIQNYYLPNSNDIDIITLVDTQVRYNTQYQYAIWKYDLIIHPKWITLVEKLVAGDLDVRVVDAPPMPPEVDFIPYRGINDRLLINLNSAIGSANMEPIVLSDAEFTEIAEIATAQIAAGVIEPGPTIRFASDDPPSSYEAYRMTEKPFDYQAFAGSLIERMDDPISSFIDIVVPNTKYYYMFRSVDAHDHLSNPTVVYEVELVDNAGSVYPLIKQVELEIDAKRKLQTQKTMKKHLLIKPSFLQGLPNVEKIPEEASEGANITPVLGLKPKNVFGRNYKIRLSSKRTGKKIDINISFEHKHTKT